MSKKIVIAKAGFNVRNVTDPNNLIYSSDYDSLKYETTGIKVVTVNRANYYHFQAGFFPIIPDTYYNRAVGTVAHGLGYTPYFSGYCIFSTSTIQAPFYFGDAGFIAGYAVYADATNLHFMVNYNTTLNSGTEDFTFRYRIFKNDLGV